MEEGFKHSDRTGDVPANASDLRTPEEISLELDRERLRFVQEERKNFRFLRASCAVVLGILALGAVLSGFTIVVGLTSGQLEVVLPAIGALGGALGGSVVVWRFYAERMPTQRAAA
jgi:hypothetical protein